MVGLSLLVLAGAGLWVLLPPSEESPPTVEITEHTESKPAHTTTITCPEGLVLKSRPAYGTLCVSPTPTVVPQPTAVPIPVVPAVPIPVTPVVPVATPIPSPPLAYDQAAYDRGYAEGYSDGDNLQLTCSLYAFENDPDPGYAYSTEYADGWMTGCLDGNRQHEEEMVVWDAEYDRGYPDGVAANLTYEEAREEWLKGWTDEDDRPISPCNDFLYEASAYDWGFYDGCLD